MGIRDRLNGRVDCVVVDSLPAQKLVEANADKMMILPFAASDTKEAYAIGLPKGSELTEEFNAAMETLNENGTYDLLVQKHISNEDVELPELPSYESKGTLTMGTNAEFEPFEYVGDDGETLMGFDIDYAKYLCATMGYDLEIENMDFDALPGALQSGKVDFLAQGTIYPDVIESGAGDAAVIKSHHNVGGLPDYVDFQEIIEPLRLLFKDEVRQLGRELGLPEYLVMRQPFPGPGLAIRVIGDLTKAKLDMLREADAIYREEIAAAGEDKNISQYFAVLTNTRSVGVMGDYRTYDYTLALRAVTTSDFMTADWARIPYEVLDRVSARIVNEVKGINRIVYDITSKPPATIEWE